MKKFWEVIKPVIIIILIFICINLVITLISSIGRIINEQKSVWEGKEYYITETLDYTCDTRLNTRVSTLIVPTYTNERCTNKIYLKASWKFSDFTTTLSVSTNGTNYTTIGTITQTITTPNSGTINISDTSYTNTYFKISNGDVIKINWGEQYKVLYNWNLHLLSMTNNDYESGDYDITADFANGWHYQVYTAFGFSTNSYISYKKGLTWYDELQVQGGLLSLLVKDKVGSNVNLHYLV